MHGKEATVYDGSNGQVVEDVSEHRPDTWASVFMLALRLKAIDCGNLSRLVVASNQADPLRVPQLEQEEKRDRLDRVGATIHVVAEE